MLERGALKYTGSVAECLALYGAEVKSDDRPLREALKVLDPQLFKGKRVLLAGGGDSAFDWAVNLQGVASNIMMIHRRDGFRAHQATIDAVNALHAAGKMELRTFWEVKQIHGDERIEAVTIRQNKTKEEQRHDLDIVIPLLGFVSDRLGRRPVMLMSFFITPAFMILLGFARDLALIGATTFCVGFFTDLYRPAVGAAIADLVPAEARARSYGYNYLAINLGAAVAPILAGLIAGYSYQILFIADALTTAACGLIVLFGTRETRPA